MVLNFVGSNNWKLLGQEKDGSILVGFEDKISDIDPGGRTNIAVYNFRFNSFRVSINYLMNLHFFLLFSLYIYIYIYFRFCIQQTPNKISSKFQ